MSTISQRIGLALACGTQAAPVGFGLLVPGGRGKPGTEETSRTDGAGTLHLLVTVSVAIARQPLAHRTAGAFNSSRPHRSKMQRTALQYTDNLLRGRGTVLFFLFFCKVKK